MKRSKPLHPLLLAFASASLCLALSGCGGGSSSGNPGPTPNYDALFAPYVGTYSGISTANPTNTDDDFTLMLAIGKGSRYGQTVPVVVATTMEPHSIMPFSSSDAWKEGRAYLKDATLSADGTQITSLNFIYPSPNGTEYEMTLSHSSTSAVLNGLVYEHTDEPPIGVSNEITLTRQN